MPRRRPAVRRRQHQPDRRGAQLYVDPAVAAGFTAVCYFFDVSTREAIGRNQHRARQVPVSGVLGTYKRIQPPSLEEGFERILRVRAGEDDWFAVEEIARAGS